MYGEKIFSKVFDLAKIKPKTKAAVMPKKMPKRISFKVTRVCFKRRPFCKTSRAFLKMREGGGRIKVGKWVSLTKISQKLKESKRVKRNKNFFIDLLLSGLDRRLRNFT